MVNPRQRRNRRNANNANGNRSNINRRNNNNNGLTNCAGVSHADTTVITRKISRALDFHLTPNGHDVETTLHVSDFLDRYPQSEKLTAVYDQYRYKNIEIWCRLSGHGTQNSANQALINASLATSIYGAVDLDATSAPVMEDVFNYDNVTVGSVTSSWRKIASYSPRAHLPDRALVLPTSVTWLNTADRSVVQNGYVAAVQMTGGSSWFGNTTTNQAHVSFFIQATIEFRGRKITT